MPQVPPRARDSALDHVGELPHVSGPGIAGEPGSARRGQSDDVASHLARVLLDEVRGQEQNIVLTFAQGRKTDLDDVHPVEEIRSESSLLQ